VARGHPSQRIDSAMSILMVDNGHGAKLPESPSNIKLSGQSGLIITGWRVIQISASESVVQFPQPVLRVGCRWHRVSGVDLGRHPQMSAGGHRAPGVRLKRHRRWVSVKTVPSKATPPRQHISGADRFISADFRRRRFAAAHLGVGGHPDFGF